MVRDLIDKAGGRKWVAFLLAFAAFVAFVLLGHIKTEVIIRDLLLGLPVAYGLVNVGRAMVSNLVTPKQEQAP
jgi:hypothetical protein